MPAKKKAQSSEAATALKESLGLLTAAEVAEALGLKLYTVQRLLRAKVIKSVRFGGTEKMPRDVRVRRQELERYVASLDAPPGPAESVPPAAGVGASRDESEPRGRVGRAGRSPRI